MRISYRCHQNVVWSVHVIKTGHTPALHASAPLKSFCLHLSFHWHCVQVALEILDVLSTGYSDTGDESAV